MKKLSAILMLCTIAASVVSLLQRNETVLIGFDMQKEAQRLADLEDQRAALRGQYLNALLDNIAPSAEEAGFVAVYTPRYIKADGVVAVR